MEPVSLLCKGYVVVDVPGWLGVDLFEKVVVDVELFSERNTTFSTTCRLGFDWLFDTHVPRIECSPEDVFEHIPTFSPTL